MSVVTAAPMATVCQSASTWRLGGSNRGGVSTSHLSSRVTRHACAPSKLTRKYGAAPRRTSSRLRGQAVVLAMAKPAPGKKEEHKIFDEVVITVRSGKGGDGEITQSGKGKWVPNHKYKPGGNSPKNIWLESGEPAAGLEGGSIILRVNPKVDALTHLHERQVYAAPKGANGNPALGSGGPKSKNTRGRYINRASPVYISVPPGTEVRKKRGNWLLGELLQPGETLVVARGGKGGHGVVAPSREQKFRKADMAKRRAETEGYEEVVVEDSNWKTDAHGEPGEELTIRLVLRVVADVGIVGLPNAGKSSLLASITRAKPEVAAYPFTTLMPNLGVMQAGSGAPVLADLPGLIEGAHEGRGLGFMFLRHLRRTRVNMHVVDAADADPVTDYFTVREELRMYNPEYTSRPHVVVLNKMDMEDAYELEEELRAGILAISERLSEENNGTPSLPTAIVSTSAVNGQGIDELNAALKKALGVEDTVSAEDLGIDPQVLEQLRKDGFDVDNLDFADFRG